MDRIKQNTLAQTYVQPQQPRPVPLDCSVLAATRVGQQAKTVQPIVGPAYDVSGCCNPCQLGNFQSFYIPPPIDNTYSGAVYFDTTGFGPIPDPGYTTVYLVVLNAVENATDYTVTTTIPNTPTFGPLLNENIVGFFMQFPSTDAGIITVTASGTACSISTIAVEIPGGIPFIPLVAHSTKQNIYKLVKTAANSLKWT